MVPIQRMVHRYWLFLLVVALLLLPPICVRAEVPQAEELLQKLLTSFETVDFEGELAFMSFVPDRNPVREARVIRKAPDKQRIEFTSPPDISGTGMVMSGNERWRIQGERGRGPRSFMPRLPNRMMQEFPLKNIQLLLENYNARVLEGGQLAGRSTYLLELEPKLAGRPSRKIWMDAEMYVILKMENYDPQRKLRNLFAYSEIDFQPEIDETIFHKPTRPQEKRGPDRERHRQELWNYKQGKLDLSKIRQAAQLGVILPDQAPAGFILRTIDRLDFGRRKHVHLRYTDGLTMLSVFQFPSDEERSEERRRGRRGGRRNGGPPGQRGNSERIDIDGIDCKVIYAGPMMIFDLDYKGIHLVLMGELVKGEMVRVVRLFVGKGV